MLVSEREKTQHVRDVSDLVIVSEARVTRSIEELIDVKTIVIILVTMTESLTQRIKT